MTPEDVLLRVAAIAQMVGDPEMAHIAEDNLHREVLRAIGDGTAEHPDLCARVALDTLDLDFSRWAA